MNIYEVSLHCEWAGVLSELQLGWMICCIWNNCAAFLQFDSECESSDEFFWLNDLLHSLHLCSFFPLCVKRWVLRCPARPNVLWHCLHLCNIFPVWVSRCLFRVIARLNDLLHSVHLCGFSPLCVSMWVLRFPARPNDENYLLGGELLLEKFTKNSQNFGITRIALEKSNSCR